MDSNTPALASTTASDQERPPQSSPRSRAALDRRNKQRRKRRKLKQQQHVIKRKDHDQWSISQIKEYLDSLNIPYADIPPIANNVLRLRFNNREDQESGENRLAVDMLDQNHFDRFMASASL